MATQLRKIKLEGVSEKGIALIRDHGEEWIVTIQTRTRILLTSALNGYSKWVVTPLNNDVKIVR